MTRQCFLVAGMLVALVIGATMSAQARVHVSIGINIPAPPQLVPVPGTAVMYAPTAPANYFFYGSQYYVFLNGAWYASPGYNGPWVVVPRAYVPRPILAVPVRYYRHPPRAWHRWHREAAPHWERGWGERWEEHPRPPHPPERR